MKIDDLTAADLDSVASPGENQWILLAIHYSPDGKRLIDELLPDSPEALANYEVYSLDATQDSALAFLKKFEIDPGDQILILSQYRGVITPWVLDELDGRFEEDLLQFVDDHASAIEMQDEEDLF